MTAGQGAQRRVLRALQVAQVLGGVGQAAGGSAGGLLALHITGSDADAGVPQAAITGGAAIAAVVASRIAARTTRRRSLGTALAIGALGAAVAAASAATHSFALLVAGSVLLGAGNAAVMLARYAATDLAGPRERGRATAAVLVATSVGAAVGPNVLALSAPLARPLNLPVYAGPYLASVAAYALGAAALGALLRPDPLVVARRLLAAAPERPPTPRPSTVARRRDRSGAIAALSIANLVMVGVMTMAPLHMVAMGEGFGVIGSVISMHIAAMFAPSPLSGRLTDRVGTRAATTFGGVLIATAATAAALGAQSTPALAVAMVLLGAGWNLTVVAASTRLTARTQPAERPRLEAFGEVGMGIAAATGSVGSGLLLAADGYAAVALAGAVAAAAIVTLPGGGAVTAASRRRADTVDRRRSAATARG